MERMADPAARAGALRPGVRSARKKPASAFRRGAATGRRYAARAGAAIPLSARAQQTSIRAA